MSVLPRAAAWCIGLIPMLLVSNGSAPRLSSNLTIFRSSECRITAAKLRGVIPSLARGLGSAPDFRKAICCCCCCVRCCDCFSHELTIGTRHSCSVVVLETAQIRRSRRHKTGDTDKGWHIRAVRVIVPTKVTTVPPSPPRGREIARRGPLYAQRPRCTLNGITSTSSICVSAQKSPIQQRIQKT